MDIKVEGRAEIPRPAIERKRGARPACFGATGKPVATDNTYLHAAETTGGLVEPGGIEPPTSTMPL